MYSLTIAETNEIAGGLMAIPGWVQTAADWGAIGFGLLLGAADVPAVPAAVIPYAAEKSLEYDATHPAAAATLTRAYTTGAAI